jgi:hypothetical protein
MYIYHKTTQDRTRQANLMYVGEISGYGRPAPPRGRPLRRTYGWRGPYGVGAASPAGGGVAAGVHTFVRRGRRLRRPFPITYQGREGSCDTNTMRPSVGGGKKGPRELTGGTVWGHSCSDVAAGRQREDGGTELPPCALAGEPSFHCRAN